MLRRLASRWRLTGVALAIAGWAATFAAVIADSHLGRGAAVQIVFAATLNTFAMGETLLSRALPVVIDDRASPGAAGPHKTFGTLAFVAGAFVAGAFVAGCMLGPIAGAAVFGADWATSLFTALAAACALASIAVHRWAATALGADRVPVVARSRMKTPPSAAVRRPESAGQPAQKAKARLRRSQLLAEEARYEESDGAEHPLPSARSATVAAVAFRAAVREPEPRLVPGTQPAPVTVTADESRPAATAATHDGAGHQTARPPGAPGHLGSVAEQMQHVFHELHADGRNTLCAVCDGQYG